CRAGGGGPGLGRLWQPIALASGPRRRSTRGGRALRLARRRPRSGSRRARTLRPELRALRAADERAALREKPVRRHLGADAAEPGASGARARAAGRTLACAAVEWLRLSAARRNADLLGRVPRVAQADRAGGGAGAARDPPAQPAAVRFRAEAQPRLERQALRA